MVEVQTAGFRLAAVSSAGTTGTAAEESAGPESAYKLIMAVLLFTFTFIFQE